jgi:hypothetical protein
LTRHLIYVEQFENTFTKLLGGESNISLSGSTLALTSPRGVLHFTR